MGMRFTHSFILFCIGHIIEPEFIVVQRYTHKQKSIEVVLIDSWKFILLKIEISREQMRLRLPRYTVNDLITIMI